MQRLQTFFLKKLSYFNVFDVFSSTFLHRLTVLFRVEKLLFRNIQPAPAALSIAANVTDVILLDTKLVPCCISPSAAATTEPPNSGDMCAAKQTGNSLTVGTGDTGSTEHKLETGSSPNGSDRPTGHRTRCSQCLFHASLTGIPRTQKKNISHTKTLGMQLRDVHYTVNRCW